MPVAKAVPPQWLTSLLFDRAGAGLCLVSPDGVVVKANAEWLRSTGFRDEQVVGASIVDLFPETRALAVELHARARAGQRVVVPRHAQVVDGRETWWEGSVEPVPMEGGTGLLITANEVSAAVAAEQALRAAEERSRLRAADLQAVLDAVPAVVWIARDPRAEVIEGNRIGDDVLRRPRGSNLSLSAAAGVRPTNFRVMRDGVELSADELPIQAVARTGSEIRDCELDLVFDDGSVRHLLGNVAPLLDPAGGGRGSVGAFIDVTDRKQAEEALRRANAQLHEADRRKDEYLAVLSHELRNPLAPIRNSAYVLRHAAPGSDQARRAQAVIERQADHLTRLVDDLLDVTRVARGRIELRRSRIDLREVVGRAADDFRVAMDERGLTFRAVLTDGSVWVQADATRVTQIVGNLLHNACKFTRRGDEVVLVLDADATHATIRVRDTGAGIAPELLPRLFEPFVQGDRTLARAQGGLGLGLALVKGVAELHGGSVEARSGGKGQGAEFVVRLPLGEAAAGEPAAARPLAARGKARRRVLVVDDNRDAAHSLADIVTMLGHGAEVAYDGPTAVEKTRALEPEIVLCDVGLPGMSGYEVARSLRAAGTSARLFAVSGYAQPEDVRRAIEAGFDGHLAKPVDPEQVERLLS
jgi:PAS domain S-box-containing protein